MEEEKTIVTPQEEKQQHEAAEGAEDLSAEKDTTPKKSKKKKKTAKDHAIRLFVRSGITALVIVLTFTFVFGVYIDHNNASYPMIKDGDLCLTFKLAKLDKGDVVAIKHNGEVRFARVIALQGDTVEIKNDFVSVNGTGVFEDTVYGTTAEGSKINYPYKVPEGTVFVLNDFRSDTYDSRTLGGIPLSDCRGKVIFIMRRRGI